MSMFRNLAVVMTALALAACAEEHRGGQTGTLMGAGSHAAPQAGGGTASAPAIVGGTLAGTWIGHNSGKLLDNKDHDLMEQSTQHSLSALPAGRKSFWRNPANGHSGSVTPQIVTMGRDGEKCREYQQTVSAGGKIETSYGKACLKTDGSWRVLGRR